MGNVGNARESLSNGKENKTDAEVSQCGPTDHTHTPLSLNTNEGFCFGNVKVSVVGAGSPPKACRKRRCAPPRSLNCGPTDTNTHEKIIHDIVTICITIYMFLRPCHILKRFFCYPHSTLHYDLMTGTWNVVPQPSPNAISLPSLPHDPFHSKNNRHKAKQEADGNQMPTQRCHTGWTVPSVRQRKKAGQLTTQFSLIRFSNN